MSQRDEVRTARRPGRPLSTFELMMLVVSAAALVAGLVLPPAYRAVAAPTLEIVTTAAGQVAKVDDDQWRAACAAAGFPELPGLDGSDPVPAGTILEAFESWQLDHDPTALGRMGQVYLALEEHEAALAMLAAATGLAPDEPRWRYLLAAEAQTLGRTDLAMRLLEEAGRLDPDYPTTFARLGALHLERGDLEAATAAYEAYRARRPGESLGHVGLGRVALARGDLVAAELHFREAVAQTPNDFLAHRFLARTLAETGRDEAARRAARASDRLPRYAGWLSLDERLREAHAVANTRGHLINRMRAAASAKDLDAFVAAAEEVLQRYPADVDTAANLATAYRGLERPEDADRVVADALRRDPESAKLHCVRADIAWARRDVAAMHRALDEAERIDPGLARIHDLRGRALYVQRRLDEAIVSMTRANELEPGSSRIRLTLADMLYRAGQPEGAIELIEQVMRDDPENPLAPRLLEAVKTLPPTP